MSFKPICTAIVTAVSVALLAAPQFAQGEQVFRAVSAFPKTNPLTQSFLRFIDKANKNSKGLFTIRYIGGPEVTKPREQPNAMRNGLFDMMYGPGPYYVGLLPELEFYHYTVPKEARANGLYDLFRPVMKEKMGARFMGWFDSGWGLHLFTVNEPKRTASGGIDLTGLKLRSSPAYRDFIKVLGGTAVVMSGGEMYTALQRGTIDGMGTSVQSVVDLKLVKFVKYRIDPPMTHPGILMNVNQKVWDSLPKEAQDLLDKLCADWEVESRAYWKSALDKLEAKLASEGMKVVTLPDAAAKDFVRTFRKGPWARLKKNPKVKIDLDKLKKLVNYEE